MIIYVLGILAFAILMFEPREELILLYLPFTYSLILLNPEGKIWRRSTQKSYRILLLAICLLMGVTVVYFRSEYNSLLYERLGNYSSADYFFSIGLIILAFLLTWANYGVSIPILALIAMVYAYFGQYFPGFLYHKGISIERIIAISATEFNSGDGVLGSLPQIAITWIAIFTIFAGLASGFGILEYIIKISYSIFKKFKYGVPQVAVISSMIFGMFSGSGAANVAGTGSFTIPLMKRYRMPAAIAGAIESVASSGGQVMPPVMGAAAFVMASYLGKYYWQIVVVGFLPALIFYACVALAVYIYSRQFLEIRWQGGSEEVSISRMAKGEKLEGIPIVVAILVLLVVMSVYWVDVMIAGFAMVVAFLISWIICQIISMPKKKDLIPHFLSNFLKGAKEGAETTVSITTMMACIGIIVAVLVQTGLAQKLSFAIVEIAGGNKVFLILLASGLCILFGMVVSTVAAYILTVTLVAPILASMGVSPLITHFSVFYFAMMGLITPPVAPCCAVASGIAKASFLKICWYSLKIGFPLFILPLSFFSREALIMQSQNMLLVFLMAGMGMATISLGINLRSFGIKSLIKRVIYIGLGLFALFNPSYQGAYLGLSICIFIFSIEVYRLGKGKYDQFKEAT
ncbi:MAG: TRAP transporter permease [Thermodesulfobacteriota bacterium]